MDETQHFCLRWNNYQSSITSAFENLRDDEDFVDVTLACEGRSIKAHRVVLSACSPYFRDLLKSTPCKHPVILLQDVNFLDLHSLVEFIYHGEVNVHQKSLQSFLKTAEVLRVSGLTQQQAEDTHSHLAQIQNLANAGIRGTSLNSHGHVPLHDDTPLYASNRQDVGSPPPPPLPQQHPIFKRLSLTRERHNLVQSAERDEQQSNNPLKRLRSADNGLPNSNNNSPDIPMHARSTSPQMTAADFSTIKHNNNNTPPLKEEKRNGPTNGNGNATGNGISVSDKLGSLTPSPLARSADDVKSEPMELVCANNNPSANDEQSNDSTGEHDANRSSSGDGGKGSLSSCNDEEIDNSIASSHPTQKFLISPGESKMFNSAFNFSIGNLDHQALIAGLNTQLAQPGDLVVSPQGSHSAIRSAATSPTSSTSSPPSPPTALTSPTGIGMGSAALNAAAAVSKCGVGLVYNLHASPPRPGSVGSSTGNGNSCGGVIGNATSNSSSNTNTNSGQNSNGSGVGGGNGGSSGGGNGGGGTLIANSTTNNAALPQLPLRMPPPTSGGINEPQECPYCRRTFSCYYSLKRHFQDKHEQSDTLYVCEFCHRRYRTKNSLTTHKSLQHRGSSGMLKRLLKTSAIKHGLVAHHGHPHSHSHTHHHHALTHPRAASLFDFASELGQPPPGIQ